MTGTSPGAVPAGFGSVPGGPVTRTEVIARARFWVAHGVHYLAHDGSRPSTAPDPHGRPYRADCSGYVCMTWHAEAEPSTERFDSLGAPIGRDELLPGDALLWAGEGGYGPDGGHVVLFGGWSGPERVAYLGFELCGGRRVRRRRIPFPTRGGDPRYVPWRYRNITG